MNKSQKFLTKLLTTSSALAVLAGGANSTIAGARIVEGNATFATGVGLDGGLPFGPSADLTYDGLGAWTTMVDVATTIQTINTDGAIGPGLMTINGNDVTIGNITGANILPITIATANKLTLSDNTVSALGDITFGAPGATLKLTNGNTTTIGGTLIGPGGNIEILDGSTIFNALINLGKNSSLTFSNDGTTNFADNVTIANIDFNNNNRALYIADGKNLTGDVNSTGGINGALNFIGTNTLTGNIGNTGPINNINLITTDGIVNVTGNVTAGTLGIQRTNNKFIVAGNLNLSNGINFNTDGTLELNGNGDQIIAGNIQVPTDNTGTITANLALGKSLIITGSIGQLTEGLKSIEAKGGRTVLLSTAGGGNQANIKIIDISGGDGILKIQGYDTIFNLVHDNGQGNLVLSETGVNGGIVAFGDGTYISSKANPLNKVIFSDTGVGAPINIFAALNTTPIDIYANSIETTLAGTGLMLLGNKSTNVIDAPVGSKALPLKAIALFNTGTVVELRQPAYFSEGVAIYPDGTLKVGDNITIIGGGPNPIIGGIFGLDVPLQPNPQKFLTGTVIFNNPAPATLAGEIGFIKVTEITDQDVTITSNLDTQTLNFTNAGQAATLTVNGKTTIGTGGITTAGDLTHTLKLDGDFSSIGNVGAPNHRFVDLHFGGNASLNKAIYAKSLTIDTNKTLTLFDNNQQIEVNQIYLNGDSTLNLAGGEVFLNVPIEIVNGAGQGTIVISDAQNGISGFGNGSIVGTTINPLNKIIFHDTGNKTPFNVLAFQGLVDVHANSIETDLAGKGIMLFIGGTSIIDAPIGKVGAELEAIALQTAGTVVTLTKDAYFNSTLVSGAVFFDNVTLRLGGNYTGNVSGVAGGGMAPPPFVGQRFGSLEFINTASKTFTGDAVFLNEIRITDQNQTITGNVDSTVLNFTSAVNPATLTIGGSTIIGAGGINTAGDLIHSLELQGTTTIGGNIGSLTHRFKGLVLPNDPAKVVSIQGTAYVDNITADNSTITLTANTYFPNGVNGNNTTFNLGTNTLNFSGNSTFSGNITFNTTLVGNTIGHIVVDGNTSEFDFSKAASTTIILNANTTTLPLAGQVIHYTLFDTTNNGLVNTNTNVVLKAFDTNQYVKWTYDATTFTLSETLEPTIGNDVKNGGGNSHDIKVGNILSSPGATGNAAQIQFNFGTMTDEQKVAAIARLEPAENTKDAEATNVDNVETAIGDRLFNATLLLHPFTTAEEGAGIAAGDEEIFRHGIWFTPFYSTAAQKKYSIHPGYKTKSGGASLGYDSMVNDDLMLGAAFSLIATDIKSKDQKAGDGAKADTMMLSLYGLQEFKQNWFVQAIASFGSSTVRNHEQRNISATQTLEARSKYESMVWSVQAVAGKYFNPTQSITLTPMAGLRYERFNSTAYQETGASFQNLWVKRKASDTIDLIVGGRATTETEFNQITIIPQIYGFANFDLRGKPARMEIRIEGLAVPLPDKAEEPTRRWYSLGGGVTVKYGRMELGAMYEAQLDKKYIGHQGTLKVRVNF